MTKHRSILVVLSFLLLIILAGCSTGETQIVKETVVVEVPVEVTKIVERVVEVEVPVDENGDRVQAELPTPEPAATLPPVPTAQPTPMEVGERGEFTEEDLEKLWDIWQLIEQEYFGDLPTDDNLTDAIILAMIEQLGDDFTNYYPPAVAQRINDGFRGDFEGIGAYVNTNDEGYFYIVRPIPDTPASRAGLKPNDLIIAVDGTSIVGWTTDEVVAIVRGPRGEAVTLTVIREGEPAPFDVSIVRDRIQVPVVESQTLGDGKIGYVQLISFNQLATEQLTIAVQQHIDNGAEALIFDLRDNGGGLLTQAISVGDLFLDDGRFLIVRDSGGREDVYETDNGEIGEQIPMVLLINSNSASASEIVAAALKEQGRATLIGTQTFGKGSVQTPYNLDDGSEFRVTTANFFSPDDNIINRVGVSPDIVFEHTPELLGGEDDLTLQRAVEFILTGE